MFCYRWRYALKVAEKYQAVELKHLMTVNFVQSNLLPYLSVLDEIGLDERYT